MLTDKKYLTLLEQSVENSLDQGGRRPLDAYVDSMKDADAKDSIMSRAGANPIKYKPAEFKADDILTWYDGDNQVKISSQDISDEIDHLLDNEDADHGDMADDAPLEESDEVFTEDINFEPCEIDTLQKLIREMDELEGTESEEEDDNYVNPMENIFPDLDQPGFDSI